MYMVVTLTLCTTQRCFAQAILLIAAQIVQLAQSMLFINGTDNLGSLNSNTKTHPAIHERSLYDSNDVRASAKQYNLKYLISDSSIPRSARNIYFN